MAALLRRAAAGDEDEVVDDPVRDAARKGERVVQAQLDVAHRERALGRDVEVAAAFERPGQLEPADRQLLEVVQPDAVQRNAHSQLFS